MDTTIRPVWKDGRLFDNRVRVWHGNRFVYRVTPIDAFRLCIQGSATPSDEGKKIFKLELIRTPKESDRLGPATPASASSYSPKLSFKNTIISTRGELLPNIFSFKKLEKADRWAYLLSQTDCLAPWPSTLPIEQ